MCIRDRGRGPSFEQTWIPFTQGCFVPSLVVIGPVVLEKKMKMRKVYDHDDNGRWQQTMNKELGPRTANMALSICLKMKMIKVLKSDYSANESLLILCRWLWRHFLTGSCIMTSQIASLSQKYDICVDIRKLVIFSIFTYAQTSHLRIVTTYVKIV